MRIKRSLIYLLKKNRRYRKLLFPVTLLVSQVIIFIFLSWQLFGEKYQAGFVHNLKSFQISNHTPLVVVKFLHSERIVHPFGSFIDNTGIVSISKSNGLKAFCFICSLCLAMVGIMISVLWIKRYLKQNKLNVQWWLWTTSCVMGHLLFYILSNNKS